jgi:electron transport complex protein RnfC
MREILLPNGISSQAVVIDLYGSFSRLGKKQEVFHWKSLSAAEIDHILGEKGVLRLDRDPESLRPILSAARKNPCPTLIVNAIDVEPYCRTEGCLASERPEQLSTGVEIALKACGAVRVLMVYSASQEERVRPLLAACGNAKIAIEPVQTANAYPQGFASQIRKSSRRLPARLYAAGEIDRAIILNLSTLMAVYDAIVLNKTFVERVITISGEAIKRPAVLKVRVGMRIGDIIEECGGFKGNPERIVVNGPMTGYEIRDLDLPVMKGTTSILALSKPEIIESRKSPCIRCARCREVCPEALDPEYLFRLIDFGRDAEAMAGGLDRCTLCATCGYVCPSRVSLVEAFGATLRKNQKRSVRE